MAVDTIRKRFPNQEQNEIHREKVEIPFLYIKWESVEAAKANLNPVAFCLWLYLARHKDGTKWILDPELGYLVPVKGTTRDFDFYEYPEILKQKRIEDHQEQKVTIHKESGDSPAKDGFIF